MHLACDRRLTLRDIKKSERKQRVIEVSLFNLLGSLLSEKAWTRTRGGYVARQHRNKLLVLALEIMNIEVRAHGIRAGVHV